MDHYPRGGFPALREAETAVANPSARRAHPGLVQESILDVLSVAIEQTRTTKLSTDTAAVDVVAHGFCINCLLSALVASGTVYAVIDLFGRFNGHFVYFPSDTDRLAV